MSSEKIDPWKALRFACDGLERICMGTADEADSSSIAEKALFAAIGHMRTADLVAGEDATGNEPEAAKIIVVVEASGKERRYDANDWTRTEDGGLLVLSTGTLDTREACAARYAQHAWLSARFDGAATGDPFFRQGKKLAIALDALRTIHRDYDTESTAGDALDAITELDL